MDMDDRLMTVKELSAYLNLNERTVLKLAAEGPLPAVKVGNQWRFRDRKSTRLNSSHGSISYAVFCLKKKKQNYICCSDHCTICGERMSVSGLSRMRVVMY